MSLIGAISSLKTGVYTFTRRAPDTRADGYAVPGAVTTFADIAASVQPATSAALKDLPEGARVDADWVIYCATEIRPKDVWEIEGVDCKVIWANHWRAFGAQHWVATASKTEKP